MQVDARPSAHATGLQTQQAGFGQHFEVLDRQRQACVDLEMVNAQAEVLAVARRQVDDQVETCTDVHAQHALGAGRDRQQVAAEVQVQRRLQAERISKVQRYLDLAADKVVARRVVAKQS